MWTTAKIRRHINEIPDGQPFATRDFLNYGKRAAVDQALYYMVKAGDIVRLARGVFAKIEPGGKWPSALEVAKVKAEAFAKRIFTHGLDVAHAAKIVSRGNIEPTFACDGHTSSFKFGDSRIHFKMTSARDRALRNQPVGQLIRALKVIGKQNVDRFVTAKATFEFGRMERNRLKHSCALMPAWMSDMFVAV